MIVDTGLNATLKYMSSPLLIPPCIPPEKLDLVLLWTEKLSKQRATSRGRDSSTLKKIRAKSNTPTGTKKQNNNSGDQFQFPSVNNSLKLKE